MQSLLPSSMIAKPQPAGWCSLRLAAKQLLCNQELAKDFNHAFKKAKDSSHIDSNNKTQDVLNIRQLIVPEAIGANLVFINGIFDPTFSDISQLPSSVQLVNLAKLSSDSTYSNYIGSLSKPDQSDLLTNLNSAQFIDGALLLVPSNIKIATPIQVLFINNQPTDQKAIVLPRLFVMLESGSLATLLESHCGFGQYNTYAVTEVTVGTNAKLTHERMQKESIQALHYSNLSVKVADNGCYDCHNISLGGYFSWFNQTITMSNQNGNMVCDGLTMLNDNQFSKTKSYINHAVANSNSNQTNRIIANDHSLAVFEGIIHVHKGATGTNAKQQCQGLLLSPKAQINAKPQLQIYTDDVKCTHEAAIGQLDPDMLFYLQSRGLELTLAKNLLTYAFASQLLTSIAIPSLTNELGQIIMARTNTNPVETLP